jgi:hypothetical protein
VLAGGALPGSAERHSIASPPPMPIGFDGGSVNPALSLGWLEDEQIEIERIRTAQCYQR